MRFSSDNIIVRAFWYDRTLSWEDFVSSVKYFIQAANREIPSLRNYRISKNPKKFDVVINSDLSNLEQKLLLDVDYDQKFINEGSEDKSFNRESHSWYGFSSGLALIAESGDKEIWVSYKNGTRKSLNIRGEVVHGQNSIILEIDPQFEDAVAENLLRLCIDMFHPSYAYAGRMRASKHLHQPVGDNWIGWLTYLRDGVSAQQYLPSGIESEILGEGLLIRADDRPCQADNEAGVAKLWSILQALQPRGYLSRTYP